MTLQYLENNNSTISYMMKENEAGSASLQRITVIDALRGFALIGVILMHMLDYFGYAHTNLSDDSPLYGLDTIVHWFSNIMIRGKFISIFSFLFGLSFYIQMERASKKGIDFRGRFLWRMLLLFIIGLIGTSFTYPDILTIYAVFGAILVFLYPLRNWILMLIVFLLLLGVPNLFLIGFDNIKTEKSVVTVIPEISAQSINATLPVTTEQMADDNTLRKFTFLQSAKENLTVKTIDKLKFQFIYSDTGYLVLALFISGLIVGRLRFFEQVHIRKKRNVFLFASFMLVSLVMLLTARIIEPNQPVNLLKLRAEGGNVPFIALLTSTLNNISTITISGALAMGFIALYQISSLRKYLNLLTPYGRMGLTNYEMQNVIGSILFSAWGFGSLFGNQGPALLFVLGLIIYSLQVIISGYWMRHFLYGPLEWFWRSGTYLKWQLYKRKWNSKKVEMTLE